VYVLYPSPHLPVLASDLQQIAVVSCDHQHSVLEREMGGRGGDWRECCGAGRQEIRHDCCDFFILMCGFFFFSSSFACQSGGGVRGNAERHTQKETERGKERKEKKRKAGHICLTSASLLSVALKRNSLWFL